MLTKLKLLLMFVKEKSPSKILIALIKAVANGTFGKKPQAVYWKLEGFKTWFAVVAGVLWAALWQLSDMGLCWQCGEWANWIGQAAVVLAAVGLWDASVRATPPVKPVVRSSAAPTHFTPEKLLLLGLLILPLPACEFIQPPPSNGQPYLCEAPPDGAPSLRAAVSGDLKPGAVIVKVRQTTTAFTAKFSGLANVKTFSHLGYVSATVDAETLKRLARDPGVVAIWPEKIHTIPPLRPAGTANSWGQDAIDQRSGLDGEFNPKGDGFGTVFASNDTGVTEVQDLEGRVLPGHTEHGSSWQDGHGHGTHTSGTGAGSHWGVAKAAKVLPCKSLSDSGSGSTSQVIGCVEFIVGFAKDHPEFKVVQNLSLGGTVDEALDDAIATALEMGVPSAIAAGNDGGDACLNSPARVDCAVTVMATNRSDSITSFSSRGQCADIAAPGEDICAMVPGKIECWAGTSMATPHVAASMLLYWQANPGATAKEVIAGVLAEATRDRISGNLGNPPPSENLFPYVGIE